MAEGGGIASLVPSGTDLVVALGLANRLVGVSHCCDHPRAVGLPVLTSSTIPSSDEAPPDVVDAAVRQALVDGGSLYYADRTRLAALAPAVVVSQDVCDVCAVNAERARGDLPVDAELVLLEAVSIAGLADDVRRLGAACSASGAAEALVAEVGRALAEVASAVAGVIRPTVVTLEWGDPPFVGGHWVPELVELAGGRHLLSRPGERSRRTTWSTIAAADPDVVVYLPCGYGLAAASAECRTLLDRPEVAALRAARTGQFVAVDATRLFSRCTPDAVVAGARTLAGILHPDRVPAAWTVGATVARR